MSIVVCDLSFVVLASVLGDPTEYSVREDTAWRLFSTRPGASRFGGVARDASAVHHHWPEHRYRLDRLIGSWRFDAGLRCSHAVHAWALAALRHELRAAGCS